MAQYLHSRISNSYLPPFGNNEGQMAPAVKPMMRERAWDPKHDFDWQLIKKAWEALVIEDNKSTFIEASPPNMMRVSSILNAFDRAKYVFSIASPYCYVASHIYNYSKAQPTPALIEEVFEVWKFKAQAQIRNCKHFEHIKLITYEDFCANPYQLDKALSIPVNIEDKASNTANLAIAGKWNSGISSIIDMTPKHLAFLGAKGILSLNRHLVRNLDILDYFGYAILDLEKCDSILQEQPLLMLDGLERRLNPRKKSVKKSSLTPEQKATFVSRVRSKMSKLLKQ